MTYTEVRRLSTGSVMELCIEKDWYTKGTNEEYEVLMESIYGHMGMDWTGNVTTEDLAEWAEDIKEHSDTDFEITDIMTELARICVSIFIAE